MTSTLRAQPRPDLSSGFLAALAGRVLLCDGATGTMLHERGIASDACIEQANLDLPEVVAQLHSDYIAAGADVIQTNTFGANRVRLADFGLEARVEDMNRRGAEIARRVAGQAGGRVFVAGVVGPLGGEVDEGEAREAFAEQTRALAAGGADVLMLQTFTSIAEATLAVRTAREAAPDLPLIAEISFQPNGRTTDGASAQQAAVALRYAGADLVGANCGEGPAAVLRAIREMSEVEGVRLVAQPSAGRPVLVRRRVVYAASAEFMADYARRFAQAGAVIVGGCCGTSPRHIGAMRHALETPPGPVVSVRGRPESLPPAEPETLRQKLAAGRFVVSVEIDPPRGLAIKRTLEAALRVKESGADCVNVGDSPMAEVRMSAIAMASVLKERAGLEAIVHCATRDRNIMALQADLMGAYALGLRNVLCIKGDPHALGSYPNAAAVWDVSAVGLIRILKGFNAGRDAINKPVRPPTRYLVGAAVNPAARDLEAEARLAHRKVHAGADFFVSQAIYEPETLERFLEAVGDLAAPLVLGIWPIHSSRQASFLNERVMPVPTWVTETVEKAGTDGEDAGLELAHGLLEKVRPLVQGVYFIPSFGRFDGIARLVSAARRLGA